MEKIIKGKYRPEIDGLRAFAVIAVIINHFNKNILPGGYLGVDIFFVISGYVITSSLAGRKNKNFLDFLIGFYERRIKRLVPALTFFVLILSLLITFFDVYPNEDLDIGQKALIGLSNITLYRGSWDYFASSTELNPFTHTWSLGVEEQFYFIFPFFIWLTGFGRQTHKGSRNLFLLILFLVFVSLTSFIYFYPINQPAAYFLMPNRLWEIGTGCLIFLSLDSKSKTVERLSKLSPLFILLMMFGIMYIPLEFAVFSTVSIVLLSSLLLISLRKGTLAFDLLTRDKIVYLGLISYSLYLWHWGVLSISRWTIGIHWWSVGFQIAIIFFIANLSYKFIEMPLRKKNWAFKRWKTISKGILIIIFSFVSLIILKDPLKNKFYLGKIRFRDASVIIKEDECMDMDFIDDYDHDKASKLCLKANKDNTQNLFFVGDSHSHRIWPGAELIAEKTNSNFFKLSFTSTTFPTIKNFPNNNVRESYLSRNSIQKFIAFEKELLFNSKSGDVIFINLRMPWYFIDNWYEREIYNLWDSKKEYFESWLIAFENFLDKLAEKKVNVIISTPTPEFPFATLQQCQGQNIEWFNKFSKKDCSYPIDYFESKNGKYSNIINSLKKISIEKENLYLFDALSMMCPNNLCKYNLNGNLLYVDDDHLSEYSAKFIYANEMLNFLQKVKLINSD